MRKTTRLALAAAVWLGSASTALAVEEGEPAPAFSVAKLEGGGKLSLDQYRGKVVYLDFWASWCGPCLVSLPAIDELRKEFPASDFQVLAVNLDTEPGKARSFLARKPVGYPSASDPKGRVPAQFGLETMPTSYLIDRDGVVRYVHAGFKKQDVSEIRDRIRGLVGTQAPAKKGGR